LADTADQGRKRRLEREAVDGFLLVYRTRTGNPLYVLRPGKPPEPDIICRDERTGEEVGIEVGTAYYEDGHAKAVWEAARGNHADDFQLTCPDWKENIRVLAQAARIMRRKARKSYRVSDRAFLVVFTYPSLFYLVRTEERLERLYVPKTHPFDEIYMLSQHGELYRLFPPQRKWILGR
jgi:hypothetical protein